MCEGRGEGKRLACRRGKGFVEGGWMVVRTASRSPYLGMLGIGMYEEIIKLSLSLQWPFVVYIVLFLLNRTEERWPSILAWSIIRSIE